MSGLKRLERKGSCVAWAYSQTYPQLLWNKLETATLSDWQYDCKDLSASACYMLRMTGRTLIAASYFDPAADAVANVTLVDTTTTNTDMRGTDGANTTTPPTAEAIVNEWET